MITKKTTPIIKEVNGKTECVGSLTEYRVLGLLVYRRTVILPMYYGMKYFNCYPI